MEYEGVDVKNYIVITSIFSPTEAVRKFAKIREWHVIVVGDKKSPLEYKVDNCTFLSVENKLNCQLEDVLPYNHYARKMLGYVYAIKHGAECLADSDDDNIPYDDWGVPDFDGQYLTYSSNKGFVNIYEYFSSQKIWPRGFPLNKVSTKTFLISELKEQVQNVGIWQGLADKSPDVDAIYRLTDDGECFFKKKSPIVLDTSTYCPFNSQNTIFRKELFPLMYLPATVSFRFTDILRGLMAQPIMQLYGFKLGFCNATVLQERNEHDYLKDFQSEIPMYLNVEKVIDAVKQGISIKNSIGENLYFAYEVLFKAGIVKEDELTICQAWLNDINCGKF